MEKLEPVTVVQQLDEDKLDELVQRIDKEAEWADDYECNNEDSSTAEYVASLGYGDADGELQSRLIDILEEDGDVDDGIIRALAEAMENASDRKTYDLIEAHSELRSVHGWHDVTGSVYSMSVGEREWELDYELVEELEKLSEKEWEYVQKNTQAYMNCRSYVYVGSEYDRWHLIVDVESLVESLDIRIKL
jgi:hypothetical protein